MVPVTMPALKPGAVIHGPRAMTDTLLGDFAGELQRRGFKVAGLIQRNLDAGDACACVMELVDMASGEAIRISQELGAGSTSCRVDPAGIAEAFERAARRVETMQDTPPEASDAPAAGAIVPVSEAALPSLCAEEDRAVGWILSVCSDRTSAQEWPADVRRFLLNHPELVEVALARRLRAMRGASPAVIARMLKVFQDRVSTFNDIEALEADLTADIATLAAELPEELLKVAYTRVNAMWKAGFTRRPAAGDFMAAVKAELSARRDEIRWLKTGLSRIHAERHRQDARRQATKR